MKMQSLSVESIHKNCAKQETQANRLSVQNASQQWSQLTYFLVFGNFLMQLKKMQVLAKFSIRLS